MAGDKNKLTEKQRQILEYLKQEILQRGFPPSVREICEAVSLRSTSSVHAHPVSYTHLTLPTTSRV